MCGKTVLPSIASTFKSDKNVVASTHFAVSSERPLVNLSKRIWVLSGEASDILGCCFFSLKAFSESAFVVFNM